MPWCVHSNAMDGPVAHGQVVGVSSAPNSVDKPPKRNRTDQTAGGQSKRIKHNGAAELCAQEALEAAELARKVLAGKLGADKWGRKPPLVSSCMGCGSQTNRALLDTGRAYHPNAYHSCGKPLCDAEAARHMAKGQFDNGNFKHNWNGEPVNFVKADGSVQQSDPLDWTFYAYLKPSKYTDMRIIFAYRDGATFQKVSVPTQGLSALNPQLPPLTIYIYAAMSEDRKQVILDKAAHDGVRVAEMDVHGTPIPLNP